MTTLFGSGSAPDDYAETTETEPAFFCGDAIDYYDPANSFLPGVLSRRKGIPITLSLVAAEACSQLSLPMVGLNAPMHLLLSPQAVAARAEEEQKEDGQPAAAAAAPPAFVLDCFGGRVLRDDEAALFIMEKLQPQQPAGAQAISEEALQQRLGIGRSALAALRGAPMTPLQWGARILRNLRGIYTRSGDVVRLLGVCDRLRQIGAHSRLAVSDDEVRECAGQVALCVYALRWQQRREEARSLLKGLLTYSEEAAARNEGTGFETYKTLDAEERGRIEALLAQPWFAEAARE